MRGAFVWPPVSEMIGWDAAWWGPSWFLRWFFIG